MTRAEVAVALSDHGAPVPDTDAARTHVLLHATTRGLACRGPDRGRDATFVRLDRWLPNGPAGPRGDDALAELARRYFRAFSPATARDFTTWSGLPSGRALELIRDDLTPLEVFGRPGWRLGDRPSAPGAQMQPAGAARGRRRQTVRLIPAWDNYLVGYAHRDGIVPSDRVAEVYVGGMIRPSVLVDGRVVGRWRVVRTRGAVSVEVLPFEALSRPVAAAVADEVADIEAFLAT
jgi:hypothetical protein